MTKLELALELVKTQRSLIEVKDQLAHVTAEAEDFAERVNDLERACESQEAILAAHRQAEQRARHEETVVWNAEAAVARAGEMELRSEHWAAVAGEWEAAATMSQTVAEARARIEAMNAAFAARLKNRPSGAP